jgi:hypothetical protein
VPFASVMRLRRWLAVLVLFVNLGQLVLPFAVRSAAAAATNNSTFMFGRTSVFSSPNGDMTQGYTPAAGSTTCAAALTGAALANGPWTCTWSSDTFSSNQAMLAGTTTVNFYPENNVSTIAPRLPMSSARYDGIQFRAAGALGQNTANNVGSLQGLTLPAATAVNDLLILVVISKDTVAHTVAGWTQVQQGNSGTSRASVWYKRAVSGETIPNVVHDNGSGIIARIIGFSGVDTTTAVDASGIQANASSKTITAPTITTTVDNDVLVVTGHIATTETSISSTGWTQAFFSSAQATAIAANYSVYVATGIQPAVAITAASTAAVNNGVQLALRPLNALSITTPVNTVVGDVMIASIAARPSTTTTTTPAGWTLVRRTPNAAGTTHSLATYYKVAVAGDLGATHTWVFGTPGAAHSATGGIQSFSGVDTTSLPPYVIENGQANASSTDQSTPSVTPSVGGTMIVTSHAIGVGASSWTPLTGLTEGFDIATTNAGGISNAGYYGVQATATSTGA